MFNGCYVPNRVEGLIMIQLDEINDIRRIYGALNNKKTADLNKAYTRLKILEELREPKYKLFKDGIPEMTDEEFYQQISKQMNKIHVDIKY